MKNPMPYARLVSTGSYLPQKSLKNTDIAEKVDTSHDWIVDRTGIHSRHIVSDNETTTQMGVYAAKAALDAAGLSSDAIDLIIVATCTPDKFFPSTACLIQDALDIPVCPAFDVSAACSGFMYGLNLVNQFIQAGTAKKALLIGTESMSRLLDWTDRRTCILFGDGAGAAIFEASDAPGILGTNMGADGRQKDLLYVNNQPGQYLQMEGNAVFKLAVKRLEEIAANMLTAHHLSVSDLDWLVPHQANIRIIQATAEKLGLPMEKVILTLATQGNTSAATIPLALDEGIRSGKIKQGHHLLLEAFGGGLTWGSALLRY